jgi:hypothetical protein
MIEVEAPWTDEQVENLRQFQASPRVHPFTHDECAVDEHGQRSLIPTRDGWVAHEGGPVVQDWAWSAMLDGSMLKSVNEMYERWA